MNAETVVLELWACVQARDWPGMRRLLSDDLVVEWPVTGETFVGPDNYVAVQSEYPEGWSIRVLQVIAHGESVAAEVEVPQEDVGIFRLAMFATVRDGLIVQSKEYWSQLGVEQPPEWRARYREPSA